MAGVFPASSPSAPSAPASTWLNLPIFFKLSNADFRVSFRLFSRIHPSLSHSGSSGFGMLSRAVCKRRKPTITDVCTMQRRRQRLSEKVSYPCLPPCLQRLFLVSFSSSNTNENKWPLTVVNNLIGFVLKMVDDASVILSKFPRKWLHLVFQNHDGFKEVGILEIVYMVAPLRAALDLQGAACC